MPVISEDEFDRSLLPANMKKDAKDTIFIAVMLGWTLHITTNKGCTIKAPGNPSPKSFHFGASNSRNSIGMQRMRKDIIKFADPKKLLAISADGLEYLSPEVLRQAGIHSVGDPGTVVDERPPVKEPKKVAAVVEPEPSSVTEPVAARPTDMVQADVHIVSEAPMLAKANERYGYTSESTIERKWSDGSVDYLCSFPKCGFHTPHRLGVRSHWTKHRGKGLTARPATFAAEVPDAVVYGPRQSRIDALAAFLKEQYEAGVDPGNPNFFEVLAKVSLTWVHEQSKNKTEHAAEREPMSDTDMLNRIRTLLDQGQYLALQQQVSSNEETIASLTSRVEAAEAFAAEQEDRANKAYGNLDTLRELLNDLGAESKVAEVSE